MKMDIRNFFKNSVVSSIEVHASEDISKTHVAEYNAAQISWIKNEIDECSVAMATIQKRRVCSVKKRKGNNNYTAYGFYRTKKGLWTRILRRVVCFAQLSLVIVTWLQVISKNIWRHSTLVIKINQGRSLSHVCKIIWSNYLLLRIIWQKKRTMIWFLLLFKWLTS